MRFRAFGLLLSALVGLLAAQVVLAAAPNTRAKPPKWQKSVSDVFFADAREKLVGERPADSARAVAATSAGTPGAAPGAAPAGGGGGGAWSKLISPETLEDEIKAQQGKVSENVTSINAFKGGGFKDARMRFSVLAMMFGIVAEFDGEVRWQKQSAGMRDLIARVGHNCKVATDASYNESKARKDDLETLVRGGGGDFQAAEQKPTWNKITDRPPLMMRLEQAQQQGIAVLTANAGDFTKNAELLLHEAQIVAAIAEVITREGYEFADDQTYLGFAQKMRQAASDVADAVKQKNYDGARKASGDIDKACSACHEGYRS